MKSSKKFKVKSPAKRLSILFHMKDEDLHIRIPSHVKEALNMEYLMQRKENKITFSDYILLKLVG